MLGIFVAGCDILRYRTRKLLYNGEIQVNEVVIDNQKYVLPCRLKDFLDNEWRIVVDDDWLEKDGVGTGDCGHIHIYDGNISMLAMIGEERPLRWEDLIVFKVYAERNDRHPGLYSVQIEEGVNLTMLQEEVDKLLSEKKSYQYTEVNHGIFEYVRHIYEKTDIVNKRECSVRIICQKQHLLAPFSVSSILVGTELRTPEQINSPASAFFIELERD